MEGSNTRVVNCLKSAELMEIADCKHKHLHFVFTFIVKKQTNKLLAVLRKFAHGNSKICASGSL